jgi:hypothetical protein
MFIYIFFLEWPILWSPRILTFSPGTLCILQPCLLNFILANVALYLTLTSVAQVSLSQSWCRQHWYVVDYYACISLTFWWNKVIRCNDVCINTIAAFRCRSTHNKGGVLIMFNHSKHAVHASNTKNSVPFSQKIRISITDTNSLMLFREVIAVYSENLTDSLNTLYELNSGSLKRRRCGIYRPLHFKGLTI